YGVFVPAGQRTIKPESRLGALILAEATEWGIDPHRLVDAVDWVWRAEREVNAEVFAARTAARKATGLTARRINQWEDAGRDYAGYPGLDIAARELAGNYPALGIGKGYVSEDEYDSTDHAALLWDVLRNRSEKSKPKHHRDILRRAAELVAACPGSGANYFGPMAFSTKRWADYLAHKG